MDRARSSLPVPDSPVKRTALSVGAILDTKRKMRCIFRLVPMMCATSATEGRVRDMDEGVRVLPDMIQKRSETGRRSGGAPDRIPWNPTAAGPSRQTQRDYTWA